MCAWFKEWFDSDEYLQVYRHRDSQEAANAASFIAMQAGISSGTVLDLGCGAGRHSLAFATAGFEITGVDLSPNLLSKAVQSAEQTGLKAEFIRSNINTLQLDRKFDLIVNLFTSFGYSDSDNENFRLFETARNHLSPSGCFVFDYLNPAYVVNTLIPYSREIDEDRVTEQLRQINGRFIIKTILIQKNNHLDKFNEKVKMYSTTEIISALEQNGLEPKSMFGDYDGSRFDGEASPRLLLFCRHKA